jgi:hypothetical protein
MQETVIITGAGTSVPYEFPHGSDLMLRIMATKNERFALLNLSTPNGGVIFNHNKSNLAALLNLLGATDKEKNNINSEIKSNPQTESFKSEQIKFFQSFIDDVNLFQNSQIDYLLRNHSKYRDIGKALIARTILLAEGHALGAIKNKKPEENWIACLLSNIIERVKKPEGLIKIAKNLTIITFNYDILFEYYLDLFCRGDDEWGKALIDFKKNLKIIHVYGKLGSFDWEEKLADIYDDETLKSFTIRDNKKKFGFINKDNIDYDDIYKLSQGIEVIGGDKQQKNDLKHIKLAKSEIERAKKVFFLGFGFHRGNLDLLDIKSENKAQFQKKEVFYTNYYKENKNSNNEYIDLIVEEMIKTIDHIDKFSKPIFNKIKSSKDIVPLLKLHF